MNTCTKSIRHAVMEFNSSTLSHLTVGLILLLGSCSGCQEEAPKGRHLKGHNHPITALAFSPDGNTLASASEDMSVRLWDVTTGKTSTSIGHTGHVKAVAYSKDGTLMASGSGYPSEGTVIVWDTVANKEQARFEDLKHVQSICFSPDGKTLAVATCSGELNLMTSPGGVKIVDLETNQVRATLLGHEALILCVTFSPDGSSIVTGGEDMTVRFWNAETGEEERVAKFPGMVTSMAYSPDGKQLAVVGSGSSQGAGMIVYRDAVAKLWDSETLEELADLKGHSQVVNDVAFSPDGKTLATVSGNHGQGELKLWKNDGTQLAAWQDDQWGVLSVCFGTNVNTLATGHKNKVVVLWDVTADLLSDQ